MGYFALRDTNRNGVLYLAYIEYDSEKTQDIFGDIKSRYFGEERARIIKNSRRGRNETSLGRYNGTLPDMIKILEDKKNQDLERELGRPLTEEEKFSLKLTDKEIEREEKDLEDMFEKLQLEAKIRDWRIDMLLAAEETTEDSFRSKERFEDVPRKVVSAEWKKYRNNLYQQFRHYMIEKIKSNKELTQTQAQIQFNEEETARYKKAMKTLGISE